MDRRQFLIRAGLAAGQLALPRFFDRALAFVENHGEPLLELPRSSERELIASYQEDGVYWIIDGLMPKKYRLSSPGANTFKTSNVGAIPSLI